MKITPKQYAIALYEQISGKEPPEIKKTSDNFLQVLGANNDLALAERIIEELKTYWDAREEILNAQVIVARPLEKLLFEDIKKYLSRLTSIKNIKLAQTIDGSILGGAVVKYGDKVLDMSLRSNIDRLRQQLTK